MYDLDAILPQICVSETWLAETDEIYAIHRNSRYPLPVMNQKQQISVHLNCVTITRLGKIKWQGL